MHSTAEGLVRHITVTRWPGAHRASMSTSRRRTTPLPLQRTRGRRLPMPGPVDGDRPGGRNFPLPVVIGHGIFATATVVLVVLTALREGGSWRFGTKILQTRWPRGSRAERTARLPAMG